MENIIESSVSAEPVVNVEPQINEQVDTAVNEPVNAGTEEVAIPQAEKKPVQDAETNAMYAKIRREAEAKAKDEAIAEMRMEWNGKPITTYTQYKQALAEKADQDRIAELQSQGIDPDILNRYVNENPDVRWAREQREKQAAEEALWNDFLNVKKDFEGIVNPEDIPLEVLKFKDETGKSLYDSMVWHENKMLKQKIAEFEKGNAAKEVNSKNAISSTGSVTGNGKIASDYYTQAQVKAMSESEVVKNYDRIMESMKHWNR